MYSPVWVRSQHVGEAFVSVCTDGVETNSDDQFIAKVIRLSKPFAQRAILLVIAVLISVSVIGAQTVITAPPNKYSPSEDVQLGREAAAQVVQQLPLLHDDGVTSYVQSIGRRLADAIPPELQHREFTYSFKVVNVREINALASRDLGTFRQVVGSIRIMD